MRTEKGRRIEQAIAECDAYIARETRRDPALRPPEVAEQLAFYERHRAKLKAMLVEERGSVAVGNSPR